MASEVGAFAKVAIYLKDPLILSGFVVLIGFLVVRQLLQAQIIPVLQQGQGYRLLRLVLSYGFIIGLAIVLLGMGLKYRELTKEEQRRAAALIEGELQANLTVISELAKNTDTLSQLGTNIATILRDHRLKVLSGLFPPQNIDPLVDEASLTNLYIERIAWLEESRIWEDALERRRTVEACASIVRFVDRTKSTVESLSDNQVVRYPIVHRAYDSNLDIIRKIKIVDLTDLAGLYYRMSDVRVLYNRVVAGSLEYMQVVRAFCSSLPPNLSSLSAALALERLTFRLMPEYKQKIENIVKTILTSAERLKEARSA